MRINCSIREFKRGEDVAMTSSFLALAKIGVSLYNNNRCFVQEYKDVFTVHKSIGVIVSVNEER